VSRVKPGKVLGIPQIAAEGGQTSRPFVGQAEYLVLDQSILRLK